MDDNIGARDCAVRMLLGLAMIAGALILGEGATRWLAFVGLLPVASAIFGHCPGYALLGVSTVRRRPEYVYRRTGPLAN
jgi:hypothetical protein